MSKKRLNTDPLCDLCDLCAMLSLSRGSLTEAAVSKNVSHQPHPLCGLCDLCAMLSPFRAVPPRKPRCPKKRLNTQPQSPSVASVTSVRCFLRFARFSHGSRGVQKNVSTPNPDPLCGLRDLCAMLFPFTARSHRNPRCPARPPLNSADLLNGSFNLDESFSQSGT